MTISSITTSRTYLTRQLSELNDLLGEKTTQLARGKVGSTYGDVGDRRLLDIQLTQRVSMIDTYQQTITVSNLHLETLNMSLERLEDIRQDAKSAIDTNDFILQDDGQTQTQSRAELLLNEVLNIMNTEVAGFYAFGGTDAVSDPVATIDAILNGADGLDGLKTVMDEYAQANLGASNTGRTSTSALTTNYAGLVPTDSTFTVAEDAAHDFGFDISAVTSTLTNVAITGPAAADPDSFDVQFTGQPNLGETITVELSLPPTHTDTISIELTAAANNEEEGTFVIGADLEETAQNLRDALATEIEHEAQTTLRAVSDEWASDEFFSTFAGEEPQRVDGPPYDSATALTGGGSTTVAWYTGRNTSTTDARADKNAVVDTNLTVNYGVRANETPLKELVQTLAAFVAADFSGATQVDEEYYNALSTNMRTILHPPGVDQSGIVDISTDIAVAHRTISMTSDRHVQMKSSYEGTISEIEGVDKDQLAAEILQLQNNIEISYRASSIVFNLSLSDYL
ncbi:MAG: flagellar protein [Roseibium sp.]|uniref:flagellar protein n=1 Tax=Roseibium sp. TaxID=1936156 RepID=UPI001B1418FD|nr:flagellar protein [Roseibium sp.]MBO6893282.1 flagellar protein [Roseibium sp.]MBO6932751.1 flagellar protein [Roseibium sp.]